MGLGPGPILRLWLIHKMGFYITLCTVHTTQGQGQGPGPGLGTMGFCITLCTVHTTQGQGQGIIVFYCVHCGPCPGPGPVQCV